MTDGLLTVEGLRKSFGAVTAVDGVSLSFGAGECCGVIGPNGSGKTTLFDLITGFHDPDGGSVRFDGTDITGMTPDKIARQGVVRTFQIVSPFEGLTVRENLHSVYTPGIRSSVRVPRETVDRAEEVLDTLDLAHVADHEASDISGGQQKLLELGRALMRDPAVLLLDEPTAGVNPGIQDRVLETLREINDRGTTLVIIEHDMNVIAEMADRVAVLAGGRVIADDDFDAVTADERVRDAYLGQGLDGSGDPLPSPLAADDTTSRTNGGGQTGSASAGGNTGETPSVGTSSGPSASTQGSAAVGASAATRDTGSGGARAASLTTATGETDPDRLVVADVVAGYGSHVVLDGVSIRSHDGVTCVFGPNGSGKSTLLKAMTGVVPVRSGTVTYGDRSITNREPHDIVAAGITTVPQRDRVFRGLTVRENLQLGATTVDDGAVVDERMAAVLDVFPELADKRAEKARSLSGGQQVMLAIARAMMTGADVYLLDEPFSGLAPSMVDDVVDVIETLVAEGAQIVMVEQHVRAALRVADHVYILSQGEIQFDGTPGGLRDEDELVDLYLGIE